jgi:hypothetical protein
VHVIRDIVQLKCYISHASCLVLALPLIEGETVSLYCGQSTVSGSNDLSLVNQLMEFFDGFSQKFQFSSMSVFLNVLGSVAARNWNPYSSSKMG